MSDEILGVVGSASYGPAITPRNFGGYPLTFRESVLLFIGRLFGPFGDGLRSRAVKRVNILAIADFEEAFGASL